MPAGRREHDRRAAAIDTLEGSEPDRQRADGAEDASRLPTEHEARDERDGDADCTAQRRRPFELRPVDTPAWIR